jgi:hypothetical protein
MVLLLQGSATAGGQKLLLEVQPPSVSLPASGEAATVLVVVRNPTTARISNVRLTSYPDPEVRVESVQPIPTVVPGSDASWALRVSAEGTFVDHRLNLQVDYLIQTRGAPSPIPKVELATLTAKTEDRMSPSQMLEIDVRTTLASLDEKHPGLVYLVLTNKSNRRLTVGAIEAQAPSFVAITPRTASAIVLEPREVTTLQMDVSAGARVQPGKHLLVFVAPVAWNAAGRLQTGKIVSSREVAVAVFAESEILTVLGVPCFGLLPGFLILVTVGWLWKEGVLTGWKPRPASTLDLKRPEFWIGAITCSGIVAYAYQAFTGRDYFIAYGLADVINVWLVAIFVFGVGSYLVIAAAMAGWRWWWRPVEGQDPVAALRGLHRRRRGVWLDQVDLKAASPAAPLRVFLLEPLRSDRDTVWVTSAIVVKWAQGAQIALKDDVNKELEATGSAARLAALLKRGRAEKQLDLKWQGEGPRSIKAAEITAHVAARAVVEVQ